MTFDEFAVDKSSITPVPEALGLGCNTAIEVLEQELKTVIGL